MAIIGVILLIIGIVVICVRQFSTQKHYEQLAGSEIEKVGEVLAIYKETRESLGEERNSVEKDLAVMGMPECDEPLISPLGQKPCIYYSMKVTSSRTEHYTEKDSEGKTVQKTRTVTDTLDQSTNSTRFKINDGTGTIMVDPKDGTFDGAVKSVDKSEIRQPDAGASISFGGFSLNLSGGNNNIREPQTIKYEEEMIGLDRKLTVMGTLRDSMGDFVIEKTPKKSLSISTRSLEDKLAEVKSSLKTQLIVAAILGGIGLILTIIGLINN